MLHHHARPARRALVALSALSLTLAACGGGDDGDEVATATTEAEADTTAAPDATEASASTVAEAAATTVAGDTATTDPASDTATTEPETILVESFDDMPQECRDLLADFLRTIEPSVSAIDWETASIGDFQTTSDDLADEFQAMDDRSAETGCDAYDLADGVDEIQPMIDLAEAEAPGTVAWLEFLATLDDEPVVNPDLPQDCDGAIAYMDELLAASGSVNEVPFSDMDDISQVLNVISTDCDTATMNEFFARPEITEFLG